MANPSTEGENGFQTHSGADLVHRDGRARKGERHGARRRPHRPPRGGGAGFRRPGLRQSRRLPRPRRRAHPLHPQHGELRAARSDRGLLPGHLRGRRSPRSDHRHLRDVAGHAARVFGPARPGRRGHHLRPALRLLPQLHQVRPAACRSKSRCTRRTGSSTVRRRSARRSAPRTKAIFINSPSNPTGNLLFGGPHARNRRNGGRADDPDPLRRDLPRAGLRGGATTPSSSSPIAPSSSTASPSCSP